MVADEKKKLLVFLKAQEAGVRGESGGERGEGGGGRESSNTAQRYQRGGSRHSCKTARKQDYYFFPPVCFGLFPS